MNHHYSPNSPLAKMQLDANARRQAARRWQQRWVRCKCWWLRLNVVMGWPLLWLLDCAIAATGEQTYECARRHSNEECKRIWNRWHEKRA